VWASKVRLQKNYAVIITSIKHEKIIDHLISKGILTVDDRQVIEASPAQSDKNRKLLEILLQSAKNALDEFLVALRLDEVYTDLAEQIEKTHVELAEITNFGMH
jgi:NAD-dependent DNA ligase